MSDVSLVMIKPDAILRGLADTVIQTFIDEGFEIVYRCEVTLDETLVRRFQPAVNPPSEFGEGWKYELFEALSECPVIILIIRGRNALSRAEALKKKIRQTHAPGSDYRIRVIRNLLHTPTTLQELHLNVEVLAPEANDFLW